ncbi:MAG: tripartite tricarboxylate transporter TctB family protein [Thermodesulfobacteriota bacterium]
MIQKLKDSTFVIGFLLYLIILFVDSFNTSEKSRAFPLIVIIVSLVAVGLKLLIYQFPQFKFLDPSGNVAKDVLSMDDSCDQSQSEAPAGTQENETHSFSVPVKIFLFVLWLITFAAGVYYLGFLATLAVWLFFFMAGISRIKPLKALLLSVCTFTILYAVFVMLLKTHFPSGILF